MPCRQRAGGCGSDGAAVAARGMNALQWRYSGGVSNGATVAASRTQADSAAALERVVLLLGRTIAASSMQTVTLFDSG